MSVIGRDEFGLPVRASSYTVISRDADGLPVRNLQKTYHSAQSVEAPSLRAPQPIETSAESSGKVVVVRDAFGLPVKLPAGSDKGLALRPKSEVSAQVPVATSAPETFESPTSSSMLSFLSKNKQYSQIELIERNAPASTTTIVKDQEVVDLTSVALADNRRQRSAQLSRVIRSAEDHMTEQGVGHATVCVDANNDYEVTKFYARNYGILLL